MERDQTKERLNHHLNNYRLPKRNLLIASVLLFIISLFSSSYIKKNPSITTEVASLQYYINKQQKDFEKVLQDTALLRKLIQHKESELEFETISEKPYGFFLYDELNETKTLLFWNNQKVLPGTIEHSLPEGEYFQVLANGYYVVVKKAITLEGVPSTTNVYCLIPVQYQYDYETDYLLTQFAHKKNAGTRISISEKETPFQIYSLKNKPLFFIAQKAYGNRAATDPFSFFMRIVSLVLLLAYIHFVAKELSLKKGVILSTAFLLVVLIALRSALYIFPNLLNLRQFQLFDPTIYSSNWLNSSLGDLLINAILLCWVSVFAWYSLGPVKRLPFFFKRGKYYVAGAMALFGLMLLTFELANIVRSMVADSKISFNVTNFFSLDVYTIVGFVVLALLSLMYYYVTRILLSFIFSAFDGKIVFIYFLLAVIGLVYISFQSGDAIVLFYIPVLLWLIVYIILLSQEQLIVNRFMITMVGVLFWIFVFSISLASIILQENKKKEWVTRKIIAEKHDELTDPSQARTLSIALAYLDDKFLARNFKRFTNAYTNRYIRDSIINKNFLVGYRNAYTTKIYVFDEANRPLYNEDPKSYAELNNIFTVRSKATGIPGLYFHETSFDHLTYITKRVVPSETGTLGTVFIISTPKKYASEAFYPELFRQINQSDIESSPVYSFAIYSNNLLISSSNKYSFQTSLSSNEIPFEEFERRSNGPFDELWYKASNTKVVVIAKKQDS
ncbi:MAG TPA: hypothetical protein VM935_07130, partial [Chitinophagaceae bacterium]|nr:hypothetical protein [Chitinophagaceae bacterium]